ncbi:glycosyltransferase family 4 protein [Cellulosimicrobium terreum]|nr:glycosyltransferase family 4 protein [Cellulosimicrobium terreum]
MRVVHYYARFLVHPSGVTSSIEGWVRVARRAGHDVEIWCAPVDHPRALPDDVAGLVRAVPHLGRGRTSWLPRGVGRRIRGGDVCYLHEGWVASNAVAASVVRRRGATLVLMPHGVYEPGVVTRTRDVLGIRRAVERSVLRRVDRLHVFYPSEAGLVTATGSPRRPYVALPNGAPEPADVVPWQGGGGYFLWMGRYDVVHKGIDHLLLQWSRLPRPRPRLVLAGPDFQGGRARTVALVARLGLQDDVEVLGNADDARKAALARDCSAYLHPSRWESCSIMLLEMLASGVPVLVSRSIHATSDLVAAGAVVSHDFSTGDGLGDALARVADDAELGWSARGWVQVSATWDRVGDRYAGWLDTLAQGPAS